MRQERTIQATIFEVFAQHEIGCELKAMSQWLDGQRQLTSLVAGDLRRQGVRETGRRGLPVESVLRCALHQRPARSIPERQSAGSARENAGSTGPKAKGRLSDTNPNGPDHDLAQKSF
jgi:hypothetical protein